MDENKAVRVRISGRVQGVFFRAWTKETADILGLCGWVRNRKDGTVEALFKGPAKYVDDMISRCEKGPPSAKVDKVTVEDAQGLVPDRFEVKATV